MKKKVPHFKSESEEREFWATADSTRYVDWKRAKRIVFPLKLLANKRDVPYQSLLKLFLAERIERELRQRNGGARRSR